LLASTGGGIGDLLFASTTDGGLVSKLATTFNNNALWGGIALEDWGVATGVTKDIMLLGKYQA